MGGLVLAFGWSGGASGQPGALPCSVALVFCKNNASRAAWRSFWAAGVVPAAGPERSHAAWRSFCVSPDRSHAAWRPFSVSPGRSHAAWRSFCAMSPLTFRYVTFVFLWFDKDFVMLPSIFKGKPMISLCYLRF